MIVAVQLICDEFIASPYKTKKSDHWAGLFVIYINKLRFTSVMTKGLRKLFQVLQPR